jgi:hypothetical protein
MIRSQLKVEDLEFGRIFQRNDHEKRRFAIRMSRNRTTIALIEEAVQLLRSGFPMAPALYCLGTIPFLLVLFSFCTTMSYNRIAADQVLEASLVLVIAYGWMKGWQAMACRALVEIYTGNRWQWRFKELFSIWAAQIAFQPFGLFVVPVAWSLFVPGAHLSSFFLNLGVMGSFKSGDIRRCWSAAQLWVMQNHTGFAILNLLGLVVFADLLIMLVAGPYLVKMLFGVDSFMTRTPTWIFSTPILIGLASVAYFAIDLLQKAIHVIRCCDGEAIQTGEDLLRKFRAIPKRGRTPLLAIVLVSIALANGAVAKEDQLTTPLLDRKIDNVLTDSRYGWRAAEKPHQTTAIDSPFGWLQTFFENASKTIRDCIAKLMDWLFSPWRHGLQIPDSGKSPISAEMTLVLLYVLAALLAAVAIIFAIRMVRFRKSPAKKMIVSTPAPDLENENIVATELPAQEWVTLAEKKIGSGDLRLALRAMFLANLALLGSHRLIGVERWKSNRDYELELHRKARTRTDLLNLFSMSRVRFERCWYGDHEVTQAELEEYNANHERIKDAAAESR